MLRLCPDRPLPPYSYVPGHFPHPISDPRGHSFHNAEIAPTSVLDDHQLVPVSISRSSDWIQSSDYLFGIDLFNHGFYWEAHETWEQVWIELGRTGRDADFIKGLIKLAASGVKAREVRPIGVQRHARRAHELFRLVSDTCIDNEAGIRCGGMDLKSLCAAADAIAENAGHLIESSDDPLEIILPLVLVSSGIEKDQSH
ncbi:MAG: DUF309 domain-containing protein [Planctomycetota bacterium]|nr:DUF309 domain-containing protein [Planctomycetota bacterium]